MDAEGVIERLARENETDPHSKPVTKHKDDKLCFRVKFDVGEIKAALYCPTVVWITAVFAGTFPPPVGWQRGFEAASARRRRLRWNDSIFLRTEPRWCCTPGAVANMQRSWSAYFSRINDGCSQKKKKQFSPTPPPPIRPPRPPVSGMIRSDTKPKFTQNQHFHRRAADTCENTPADVQLAKLTPQNLT